MDVGLFRQFVGDRTYVAFDDPKQEWLETPSFGAFECLYLKMGPAAPCITLPPSIRHAALNGEAVFDAKVRVGDGLRSLLAVQTAPIGSSATLTQAHIEMRAGDLHLERMPALEYLCLENLERRASVTLNASVAPALKQLVLWSDKKFTLSPLPKLESVVIAEGEGNEYGGIELTAEFLRGCPALTRIEKFPLDAAYTVFEDAGAGRALGDTALEVLDLDLGCFVNDPQQAPVFPRSLVYADVYNARLGPRTFALCENLRTLVAPSEPAYIHDGEYPWVPWHTLTALFVELRSLPALVPEHLTLPEQPGAGRRRLDVCILVTTLGTDSVQTCLGCLGPLASIIASVSVVLNRPLAEEAFWIDATVAALGDADPGRVDLDFTDWDMDKYLALATSVYKPKPATATRGNLWPFPFAPNV